MLHSFSNCPDVEVEIWPEEISLPWIKALGKHLVCISVYSSGSADVGIVQEFSPVALHCVNYIWKLCTLLIQTSNYLSSLVQELSLNFFLNQSNLICVAENFSSLETIDLRVGEEILFGLLEKLISSNKRLRSVSLQIRIENSEKKHKSHDS